MEKLKSVLSHGHKKSEGEGSHLNEAHQPQGTTGSAAGGNEIPHPIYDQFTSSGHSSGTPAGMSSNTTNTDPLDPKTQGHSESSSLKPHTALANPDRLTEDASTASIRSGVMGHPQSGSHYVGSQNQTSSILPDRTVPAGAPTGPGLHHQKDHDNLREHGQEPIVATDSDRSFPLAGGVTSRKQAEDPTTETTDRHVGFAGHNTGMSHGPGHGREGLAGAAAAATTGSTSSNALRSEQETQPPMVGQPTQPTSGQHQPGYLEQAKHTVANVVNTVSSTASTQPTQPTSGQHQPGYLEQAKHTAANVANTVSSTASTALAGATAAWSGQGNKCEHAGGEPTFKGDPCANEPSSTATIVPGPHRTDTANRIDPSLHIPGEFPETPMETPGDHGREGGEYISGTSRHPQDSSIQHSSSTEPRLNERSQQHHGSGKAAGLGAAGLGAAGAGAYAAGKHHEREPADIETATATNPYSSKGIDPRVDPNTGLTSHGTTQAQQPQQKDHHYGRNAGLAGTGAATAGGLYAAGHRDDNTDTSARSAGHETLPTATSGTSSIPQRTSGTTSTPQYTPLSASHIQEPGQKDRHYGRDAGLAGAGAATAGGLYGASHRNDHSGSAQPYNTAERDMASSTSPLTTGQQADRTTASGANAPDAQTQHHYGRDAGLAAGAGALGAGAYALHEDKDAEKHRLAQQKAEEKERLAAQKAQEKELAHQQKEEQKLAEKKAKAEQKAHEKEIAHENKKHEKELEKEQKAEHKAFLAHQKEIERKEAQDLKEQDKDHHYGRDAGLIGAGAAAAGGLYAANRRDEQPGSAQTQSSPYGAAGHDDTVSPRSSIPQQGTAHQQPLDRQHHDHNRDAGLIGTGAATAGGLYGAGHHNEQPGSGQSHASPYGTSPFGTAGQNDMVSPRSSIPQQGTASQTGEHHHGRDAGIAAGTGAAGVGAYEAAKHHGDHRGDHHGSNVQQPLSQQSQVPGASHHTSQLQNEPHEKQHHYARDAGIAGAGVVAAAGASHHANRHDNQHGNQFDSGITPGTLSNEDKQYLGRDALAGGDVGQGTHHTGSIDDQRYDPSARGAHESHHTASSQSPTSRGSRDLPGVHNYPPEHYPSKNYPPELYPSRLHPRIAEAAAGPDPAVKRHGDREVEATARAAEAAGMNTKKVEAHETKDNYHGRNAGIAAAGAGAVGAGAYAASKHHGDNAQGQQPLGHEKNTPSGLEQGQGYPSRSDGGNLTQQSQVSHHAPHEQRSEHHHGRDAGLAAGAGAAGAGLYGASTHHDNTTQQQAYPGQPTYPTQASTAQQHQHGQYSQSPVANQYAPQGQQPTEHHHGRDAGLAAGAGAAGAGLYGASKHHGEGAHQPLSQQPDSRQAYGSQAPVAEQTYPREVDPNQQKGVERTDATGEKKHKFGLFHKDKSPKHSPSNSTDFTESTGRRSLEGRNKLHKDPPPGHPAWEAMGGSQGPQHLGSDGHPDQVARDDHLHSGVYEAPHPNDQGRYATDPNTGIAQNIGQQSAADPKIGDRSRGGAF